jgi:hypothetical protein
LETAFSKSNDQFFFLHMKQTEEEVTMTHEGLNVHTVVRYCLNGSGRRVRSDQAATTQAVYTTEIDIFPPLMLLPSTWKRYNYTVKDVEATVLAMRKPEPSHLWALALATMPWDCELDSITTGVRPTFSTLFGFLFVSCKALIEKYVTKHTSDLGNNKTDVLCLERGDHKPCLPRVVVPDRHLTKLLNELPSSKPHFQNITSYPFAYKYEDVKLVPLEYDSKNELLLMARVVRMDVYMSLPVLPPLCAATAPVRMLIGDVMHVMLDECCWFTAVEDGPRVKRLCQTGDRGTNQKVPANSHEGLRGVCCAAYLQAPDSVPLQPRSSPGSSVD